MSWQGQLDNGFLSWNTTQIDNIMTYMFYIKFQSKSMFLRSKSQKIWEKIDIYWKKKLFSFDYLLISNEYHWLLAKWIGRTINSMLTYSMSIIWSILRIKWCFRLIWYYRPRLVTIDLFCASVFKLCIPNIFRQRSRIGLDPLIWTLCPTFNTMYANPSIIKLSE